MTDPNNDRRLLSLPPEQLEATILTPLEARDPLVRAYLTMYRHGDLTLHQATLFALRDKCRQCDELSDGCFDLLLRTAAPAARTAVAWAESGT